VQQADARFDEQLLDEVDGFIEDGDDLEGDPRRFNEAVVTATDWTTETILTVASFGEATSTQPPVSA